MTGRKGVGQIADILDDLSAEIETLGTNLCADPALSSRHFATLQAIDIIAQNQRWLAQLLRADCHDTAVQKIGVESLRARFGLDPRA